MNTELKIASPPIKDATCRGICWLLRPRIDCSCVHRDRIDLSSGRATCARHVFRKREASSSIWWMRQKVNWFYSTETRMEEKMSSLEWGKESIAKCLSWAIIEPMNRPIHSRQGWSSSVLIDRSSVEYRDRWSRSLVGLPPLVEYINRWFPFPESRQRSRLDSGRSKTPDRWSALDEERRIASSMDLSQRGIYLIVATRWPG